MVLRSVTSRSTDRCTPGWMFDTARYSVSTTWPSLCRRVNVPDSVPACTNPAAGAHTAPSHAEQDEVAAWTADELSRFLAWAAKHEQRWGRVWHLVAHTGMRRGEVAQLAWRAVDLDNATVTVVKAKTCLLYTSPSP